MLRDLNEEIPISVGAAADLSMTRGNSSEPAAQQATRGAGADAARLPDGHTPPRRGALRSGTRRTPRPATHRSHER